MRVSLSHNELIQRFEEKQLLNPQVIGTPIIKYYDISNFRDLLNLTSARIINTKRELQNLINSKEDTIYSVDDIILSEKYDYFNNYEVVTIEDKLADIKTACEKLHRHSKLITPYSITDLADIGKLLSKQKILGQRIALVEIGHDLMALDGGETMVTHPKGSNYSSKILSINQAGQIQRTPYESAIKTKTENLCLKPLELNRFNYYEKLSFDTNSKKLLDILNSISNNIKIITEVEIETTTKNIVDLIDYKLPEEFMFLTECLNPWKLTKHLRDPTKICLKNLEKVKNKLNDYSQSLAKRITSFRDGYHKMTLKLVQKNILKIEQLDPTVIDGQLFEYRKSSMTPQNVNFKYVLFYKNKTCDIISNYLDIREKEIILNSLTPASNECCYQLRYEVSIESCTGYITSENYDTPGIDFFPNTKNGNLNYLINYVITIAAFFVTMIVSYCYCMQKCRETQWYRNRLQRNQRRRARQLAQQRREEIELAQMESFSADEQHGSTMWFNPLRSTRSDPQTRTLMIGRQNRH